MKTLYIIGFVLATNIINGQTINFQGCPKLFETQSFVFNKTADDGYGKGIYITTPVDGEQTCGGLGTCEFKIQWNNVQSRWEFLADTGNGDFVNPYLIYFNSGGTASSKIPPGIDVGSWIENTSVTGGDCAGNLSSVNSSFTGDVQTTTLGVNTEMTNNIGVFPNPVSDFVSIQGISDIQKVMIFSITGQLVLQINKNPMNVSSLAKGVYIMKVITSTGKNYDFKIMKK